MELVDKEMRKALLQLRADKGIVANEVARLDQKIEEIELPALGLQGLVVRYRNLQGLMQQGRQVSIGGLGSDGNDRNLIEYNTFGRGNDKTVNGGNYNIIRNNYMTAMLQSDLGTIADPHVGHTRGRTGAVDHAPAAKNQVERRPLPRLRRE